MMGWNSATPIFEAVAHELDIQFPRDLIGKTEVLLALVESLTDEDWDTVDEALGISQAGDIAINKFMRIHGWDTD